MSRLDIYLWKLLVVFIKDRKSFRNESLVSTLMPVTSALCINISWVWWMINSLNTSQNLSVNTHSDVPEWLRQSGPAPAWPH